MSSTSILIASSESGASAQADECEIGMKSNGVEQSTTTDSHQTEALAVETTIMTEGEDAGSAVGTISPIASSVDGMILTTVADSELLGGVIDGASNLLNSKLASKPVAGVKRQRGAPVKKTTGKDTKLAASDLPISKRTRASFRST